MCKLGCLVLGNFPKSMPQPHGLVVIGDDGTMAITNARHTVAGLPLYFFAPSLLSLLGPRSRSDGLALTFSVSPPTSVTTFLAWFSIAMNF